MTSSKCPRCGVVGRGSFCAQCGAPLVVAPAHPARTGSGDRVAVFAAALSVGLLALVVFWAIRGRASTAPLSAVAPAAPAAEEAPPDLSTMTPRERFDRLYNRVMRAAEQGDTATVTRFSPMAFLAYGQLDSVDADARYHAAVMELHVRRDTASALRLADSIQMTNPRHLFAFMIRGTAGRLTGNEALVRQANADFLAAWDREIKAARPEYRDHQAMLDQFRDMARPPGPKASPP